MNRIHFSVRKHYNQLRNYYIIWMHHTKAWFLVKHNHAHKDVHCLINCAYIISDADCLFLCLERIIIKIKISIITIIMPVIGISISLL